MSFTALTPMAPKTTPEIVVKICTICYPNLIKSLENMGKIPFTSLSKALPWCTNFHEIANVKRYYVDILCCKLHHISQEIYKLQQKFQLHPELNYERHCSKFQECQVCLTALCKEFLHWISKKSGNIQPLILGHRHRQGQMDRYCHHI